MPLLPLFRKSNHDGGPVNSNSKECLKKSTSAQHDLRSLLMVPQVDITPAAGAEASASTATLSDSPQIRASQSEIALSMLRAQAEVGPNQRYGSRLHVPGMLPNPVEAPSIAASSDSKKGSRTWLPTLALTKCRLSRVGSESRSMLGIPFTRTSSRCSMSPSIVSNCSAASFRVNCKLCLCDLPTQSMYELKECSCTFCRDCMEQYIKIQILDGNVKILCPDGQCSSNGAMSDDEVEGLADSDLFSKYQRFKLNTEVDLDQRRTWCPTPGCETICELASTSSGSKWEPTPFTCSTCAQTYCSACKVGWENDHTCKVYTKKKSAWFLGSHDRIFSDGDGIKQCPSCHVPIERDNGCAQMMCKRCKHVFCWYCLASLDDDFLLRHYDKGPCKNKLGHSRASIIWHRAQVVGIFAGFGILLLVASPLLLLAAPCVLCCKCESCDNLLSESEGGDGATNAANL